MNIDELFGLQRILLIFLETNVTFIHDMFKNHKSLIYNKIRNYYAVTIKDSRVHAKSAPHINKQLFKTSGKNHYSFRLNES